MGFHDSIIVGLIIRIGNLGFILNLGITWVHPDPSQNSIRILCQYLLVSLHPMGRIFHTSDVFKNTFLKRLNNRAVFACPLRIFNCIRSLTHGKNKCKANLERFVFESADLSVSRCRMAGSPITPLFSENNTVSEA